MSTRTDTVRDRVGLALALLVGVVGVVVGLATGDLRVALGGVAFALVVGLATGPLVRWQRRGDGPYPTRGAADDDREAYVRLRQSGGNGTGR